MKEIPDGSVDAIITDPPYGTTACKWDSVIEFDLMWEQMNRIIKPNGAIVLFGSEPFSSALRMSNIKNYKHDWLWNKKQAGNAILCKKQPLKMHEIISVFNFGKITYFPQMTKGKMRTKMGFQNKLGTYLNVEKKKNDMYYPKSILEFSTVTRRNKIHLTQKPIALMEYLIKTYTNENETVLDFTMGSGTTGVAAKNLNRNFIGIEQDENYFNIAEKRIKETKQQTKLF